MAMLSQQVFMNIIAIMRWWLIEDPLQHLQLLRPFRCQIGIEGGGKIAITAVRAKMETERPMNMRIDFR